MRKKHKIMSSLLDTQLTESLSETEKTFVKILIAVTISGALKKIQAKQTNKKVAII